MKRLLVVTIAFLALAVTASGCSQLMAGLRKDFDDGDPYDPPTVGGAWPERGMLDDPGDGAVALGHEDRSPASAGARYAAEGRRSWVNDDDQAANARDAVRGDVQDQDQDQEQQGDPNLVSYSNTPNMAPGVRRQYRSTARATREDFVDNTPNEGSLWGSDGQTNYYFTKNKVRSVGDIVTINMEPDMVRDVVTEVKKRLTMPEREHELEIAQEEARLKAMGLADASKDQLGSSAAAPARSPAQLGQQAPANGDQQAEKPEPTTPDLTYADVDISKSVGIKAGDKVMAEIVERYPNGNYKLRGTKKIPYRTGPRLMTVTGIARSSDISEDDVINSGKLYEYRVDVVR